MIFAFTARNFEHILEHFAAKELRIFLESWWREKKWVNYKGNIQDDLSTWPRMNANVARLVDVCVGGLFFFFTDPVLEPKP